ncbi:Binding partner of ACD11 1 [Camellia lanceoleosa]|uniref:Binding partner of ACD11 1 n=1 Tax=Camellia lanceoleosa TaxID=1840588 RepID=A0ACC0HMU1_9ERIC|nr:Binding partner of ACD11 1 [Camellia lanceoleosa]
MTAEVTPPLSSSSASLESALMRIRAVESTENSVDFNFFEEEFQVQLALAISVSDPDSHEDPETVQIKDAKQISLGCVPSETLTESLFSVLVSLDASLQYVLSIVVYHEEPNWVCDVQVPMDHTNSKIGTDAPPSSTPNWTINISDVRTVKVSNISLATSEKDIEEFFSFSSDIQYVEMQRETETSQFAYVTFKESQGADTAMLLTCDGRVYPIRVFEKRDHEEVSIGCKRINSNATDKDVCSNINGVLPLPVETNLVNEDDDKAVDVGSTSNMALRDMASRKKGGLSIKNKLSISPTILGSITHRLKKGKRKGIRSEGFKHSLLASRFIGFVRGLGQKGATSSKGITKGSRSGSTTVPTSNHSPELQQPSSGNGFFQEAQSILQLGQRLGLDFKGLKTEVIRELIHMEEKDKERLERWKGIVE